MAKTRSKAAPEPPKKELERHQCAALFCNRWGAFGLGPPMQPQEWFCRDHLPSDYWSRR